MMKAKAATHGTYYHTPNGVLAASVRKYVLWRGEVLRKQDREEATNK